MDWLILGVVLVGAYYLTPLILSVLGWCIVMLVGLCVVAYETLVGKSNP